MKALILVGGFGTRLRPLTLTCPKPLVEFANKPMIVHQIEALKKAGCTEVVLAIAYRAEVMKSFVSEWEEKLGVKITLSHEEEPLGTAGPIALAKHILDDGSNEPFFVLNSDVICNYPLTELLQLHKQRGAEATILVTRVEDPSKYGVVVFDDTGLIERFVEKPKTFVGDKINAGIYVLSPSVINRIPMQPTSIERDVFPKIAADNKLYAMVLPGFWMDVGQPKDFLEGLTLYLNHQRENDPSALASGAHVRGNVLLHESVKVGRDCKIGPDVSIGEGCEIGDGVRLSSCVIMKGCRVKSFAKVEESIIGWYSCVGNWVRVENNSIVGEDVIMKDEIYLNGAIVLPHKELKSSVKEPQIIL